MIQKSDTSGDPAAFEVRSEARQIDVWSSYRLQFDDQLHSKRLKAAIAQEVPSLTAGSGEILEAVLASDSTDTFDAENVLLYNVGTARFAMAAMHGLRFERVLARGRPPAGVPGAFAAYHHAYRLIASDAPSRHWQPGAAVVALADVPVPRLGADSKPDEVWFAVRSRLPEGTDPIEGDYGLEIELLVPSLREARSADVVKPLVDGIVSAFHRHDGSRLAEVAHTVQQRLGIPRALVEAALMDYPRPPLGARRLLWPRAASHQWNPADDLCRTARLRVVEQPGLAGWRCAIQAFPVSARP